MALSAIDRFWKKSLHHYKHLSSQHELIDCILFHIGSAHCWWQAIPQTFAAARSKFLMTSYAVLSLKNILTAVAIHFGPCIYLYLQFLAPTQHSGVKWNYMLCAQKHSTIYKEIFNLFLSAPQTLFIRLGAEFLDGYLKAAARKVEISTSWLHCTSQ